MGKWVHRLSNKDVEAEVADCESCGPGVAIYVPRTGVPRCKKAYREMKARHKAAARARGKRTGGELYARRGSGARVFRNRDGSSFTLSEEEYWAARESFPQLCGTCGATNRLDLDHCHATGRLRGLLCVRCNTGMGAFGDDPDLLRMAAAYLEGRGLT